MKPIPTFIITGVLTAFGMLTLFMSSSVIFDLFNIRAHQGNYVLFIVWANFISGILFLTAAFAFMKGKLWSPVPLNVSLGILGVGFVGLLVHIYAGGIYETKTIAAMIFRMTVNAVFALVLNSYTKKIRTSPLVKAGVLAFLPMAVLVASCSHRHGDEHDHHAVGSEASHHHEENGGSVSLNNGEKWEADEHTLSVVEEMKSEVSDFEISGVKDYDVLSDSLTSQLSILVAGCTMEGPAHDELHKWLVPFTDNVKKLAAAEEADARVEVKEIRRSLDQFGEFFERKAAD